MTRLRELSVLLANGALFTGALVATGLGAVSIGITGCTGIIGGGDSSSEPGSTPTHFVCNTAALPDALPLRRMSRLQYTNTVQDLIGAVGGAESATISSEMAKSLAGLPADTPTGTDKHYAGFTNLDQAIQQEHADAIYAVAGQLGARLTLTPARLNAVVGTCATATDGSNDDTCLTSFIRSFGERALRRAITDEDVAFYKQPAVAAPYKPADYADVIALLLTAPESLFFVEHGNDAAPASASATPLSAYELASRISYHFWQTMPDGELFAKARSGELLTDAGYKAEVERAFADPRTSRALSAFFAEWLSNTTLNPLDARIGTPTYDAIRGSFAPGPDTRQHVLDEVVDAARYYAFDGAPAGARSFDAFFTSTKSFARTDDVAQIYGVAPWDGQSEPPDAPGRVGLLTRPAYVATGSISTRPITKGVFIRKALLCDSIDPPPGNAAANPPPLSADASTRQVIENLTQTGICAGCHQVQINPLGFATENFDPLGRLRTEETLFDDKGNPVGQAPLDTSSVPIVDDGDQAASTGAGDLTKLISASPKLHACFARQYFRFTFARAEDIDKDGCALSDVQKALDADAPLAEVLRAIALNPGFKTRSFE